ncbi:MAG TPA: peptidoglycan-binding domain-containing protein [Polyangium sp.]|nr:peptidoglycan-binding domain-containing protein [Polyangium sp.]
MNNLELLLAHADDQRPVLASGLPMDTAGSAPRPKERHDLEDFRHDGGDPNSLPEQRWGIVAPEGATGDRLLELIAPLQKAREEQQGEPAIVFRAPPNLEDDDVGAWWSKVYGNEGIEEADRPRYLVMLGDADVLSWELQQRLASDTFIGRLCFPNEAGYESYVHKLLASENAKPHAGSRALYYTVRDGTAATNIGHAGLMRPTIEQSRSGQKKGVFPAREIIEIGDGDNLSADDFLAAVDKDDASMLFTVSHGCGAPRGGWSTAEEQRRLQGAMSFGAGQKITAEDLANRTFLPNGLWFFFACFGAGTPHGSAYHHWLAALREVGLYGRNIDGVLASLPGEKERPFVAALPQAVLANPKGPLAVMGHVDLAWTFSFHDVGTTNKYRPSRFQDIFRTLVDGKRVGAGYFELQRFFNQASVDLSTMYDKDARQKAKNAAVEDDKERKIRKATLWMLRQDLSAYVLLGDPAARLNIEGPLANPQKRATAEHIEARRAAKPVYEVAGQVPGAAPAKSADAPAFVALSAAALDALATRIDMPRVELEQILATLPGMSFVISPVGVDIPKPPADVEAPASFGDDDSLPWHAFANGSGKAEAGQTISDTIWGEITANRAAIAQEKHLNAHGKGHIYAGLEDKAHLAYLHEYLERRMASASPADRRKIAAFRAFQAREGSTAAINTYDNQIVTWGTGWGGLGWMGSVVGRVLANDAARDLFDKCGVRYRGKNTYDVVDLGTRRVITGKKEALEVMRASLPLLWMLIHASRAPETRDAVTDAQLATFFVSAADIGMADAISTQALFNLVAHLRHWAPGYAAGCIEWALPQVEQEAPSMERDKRLAVLVGRYFYGKARRFQWIPDWKQFQLYWQHMKHDGLDCLDDPFIRATASPTEDPFAGLPTAKPAAAAPSATAPSPAPNAAPSELQRIVAADGSLRKGAHGAGVKALQEALIRLHYDIPGGPDGAFGPGLETALKAFQAKNALTPDGVAGARTIAALERALRG